MVKGNSHLLALPESARIGQLLGDLLPNAASAAGAWTVGNFLAGVNWQNAAVTAASPRPAPEPSLAPGRARGSLTVHQFLSSVNWANQLSASQDAGEDEAVVSRARMVVSAFLGEVNWD